MEKLRHTQKWHDDSFDNLIIRTNHKQDTENECCDQNLTNGTSISSNVPFISIPQLPEYYRKHQRKLSDCSFRACCNNTIKHRQRKSHSLPISYSLNNVTATPEIEFIKTSAEDYAAQLTLLDLRTFVSIMPEEFTSCCWNKRNKLEVTPNIVAFTKRFNQVSFWVVQEVLKGTSAKQRAELMSFFIRIGKKLFELSNFHSLFAIISALKSASLYRLYRTWGNISKKDRQIFEKLSDVFSEEDNWKNLREHVESLKLPCIPYLGMFLTDLVYVDVAHPHSGGMETEQRLFKMNNILRVISHLQQSQYNMISLPDVQNYLNSIQYIEELQKFIEDDQYKLSLKLEPLSPVECSRTSCSLRRNCSSCSSKEYSSTEMVASLNLSPVRLPAPQQQNKFVNNISRHYKSLNVQTNALTTMIKNHELSCNLIDDSVLEENGYSKQEIFKLNRCWSADSKDSNQTAVLEGCLKRKMILKHGCHPTVSSWNRYWIEMSSSFLFFYSPKCFKSSERSERCDFKHTPCKVWPIEKYVVSLSEYPNIFFLKDTSNCKTYKFKAINDIAALTWYRTLYDAIATKCKDNSPTNLISFE